MSLTSSIASGLSSPPTEGKRPQSRGKEKALSFLKFGKRSPKSPPTKDASWDSAVPPLPSNGDDGISTPFNFQHNIHVNEGLVGLPPTWSAALSQAGFSDEEIIAIHNRRAAGSRSPNSQYVLNARPPSPRIPHPYQQSASNVPIIAQPGPRTTSLPRQVSDASLRSTSTRQRHPIPFGSPASASTASLHSSNAGSISNIKAVRQGASQDHSSRNHTPQLSISYSSDSNHSGVSGEDVYQQSRNGNFPKDVSTPPGKPAHAANPSIAQSFMSQASSLLNGHSHNRNESNASSTSKRLFGSQPSLWSSPSSSSTASRPQTAANTSTSSNHSNAAVTQPTDNNASPEASPPQPKRTNALPPRLSLHQASGSGDLSAWAGMLLSGLSSDLDDKLTLGPSPLGPTPLTPQSAPASAATQGPSSFTVSNRPTHTSHSRSLGGESSKARPEPLSELEEPIDNDAQYANLSPPWTGDAGSSSPLWSEIEGILSQGRSPTASEDRHEPGPYSAALAETFSPTLPFSPEEDRMAQERRLRNEASRERLEREEDLNRLSVNTARPNRDSSRSIPPTPIVPPPRQLPNRPAPIDAGHSPSPPNSSFDSEESSASSSQSQDRYPTPTTANSTSSPLRYYLEPSPSPSQASFSPVVARHKEYPNVPPAYDIDEDLDEDDEEGTNLIIPHQIITAPSPQANRPTIVIENVSPGGALSTALPTGTPASPFQRYRGWLSEVVQPLEEYIDEGVDPRDHYLDLKEIAEGESGSVFSARLIQKDADKLRLPAHVKAQDADDFANNREVLVAIKSVAIVPSGSPKLKDLQHELGLMKGLHHENVIGLDSLYVDFLEDTLWIRMELMERSLADIIGLVDAGLMLPDRMMARFASDILSGLDYLQRHHIAHRDVRSDNLLINKHGVLKLTDFANAVQVSAQNPMRTEPAGVLYWQAPEVRSPPYNAMKVDVWSLGATVWEMAETQPPFADTNEFGDRWPPLSRPQLVSPAFHEFLRLCSEPAASRPTAGELLKTPFVKNACGRAVIVQLLSQCIAIESAFE
ncbi:STE/STE20/PAKA protein kinase [Coprinopsis cinerea okayama7|uniref:STE/STE20/PAKA protein kinase n=1 Tax=Coprinopsis cinerea (strain Okayama-7 / 130 / ATCC MYA-4618 / FGSC 9003) TaxID=240176 RepID=D6RPY3_COPC7|nr:STE/STE20/PAKA protein kinase [Coprinopsis cinerea okayama7\|eukprot:XP_002910397.1 STE/STE20/PAKA protein kinase [Coprinopsis cinerea okayama7\